MFLFAYFQDIQLPSWFKVQCKINQNLKEGSCQDKTHFKLETKHFQFQTFIMREELVYEDSFLNPPLERWRVLDITTFNKTHRCSISQITRANPIMPTSSNG